LELWFLPGRSNSTIKHNTNNTYGTKLDTTLKQNTAYSFTSLLLYPWEVGPGTQCIECWMGLSGRWDRHTFFSEYFIHAFKSFGDLKNWELFQITSQVYDIYVGTFSDKHLATGTQ
jgi:hypothetical protein